MRQQHRRLRSLTVSAVPSAASNFTSSGLFWCVLLIATATGCAHGAETSSALADCYAASGNRIEVSHCLEEAFRSSDARLSEAAHEMESAMQELGSATGRAEAAAAFEASQRAFFEFRERNCEWLAAQTSPGTGSGDVRRDCLVRMTRARTDELRSQLPHRSP